MERIKGRLRVFMLTLLLLALCMATGILGAPPPAHALVHAFKGLTGAAGSSDPQLDGINAQYYSNGEYAIGLDEMARFRIYVYDSTSTASEDAVFGKVVRPNDKGADPVANPGAWLEVDALLGGYEATPTSTPSVNFYDIDAPSSADKWVSSIEGQYESGVTGAENTSMQFFTKRAGTKTAFAESTNFGVKTGLIGATSGIVTGGECDPGIRLLSPNATSDDPAYSGGTTTLPSLSIFAPYSFMNMDESSLVSGIVYFTDLGNGASIIPLKLVTDSVDTTSGATALALTSIAMNHPFVPDDLSVGYTVKITLVGSLAGTTSTKHIQIFIGNSTTAKVDFAIASTYTGGFIATIYVTKSSSTNLAWVGSLTTNGVAPLVGAGSVAIGTPTGHAIESKVKCDASTGDSITVYHGDITILSM